MAEMWKLITVFACLAGFIITGGLLLWRGQDLFTAVFRALIVAFALGFVHGLLGKVLVAITESDPAARLLTADNTDDTRTLRN